MIIKKDYIILWETSEGELAAEEAPNATVSELEFLIEHPLVTGDRIKEDTVKVFELGEQVWYGTGAPPVRI